jgi:enamine deaminase RidA (YjgF/YER057c/UK114 family)
MIPGPTAPHAVHVSSLSPTGTGWAQAVVWRELVTISGQVALDGGGKVVGRGSLVTQAECVFRNLDSVLNATGSSRAGLLRLTVYVTSLEGLADLRAARNRWLGEVTPASTLVQVAGLVHEDLLIEVDALAVRSSDY